MSKTLHIGLIGPSGFVGAAVLDELLSRGHRVTALARTPSKLAAREGLTVIQGDATDAAQVARAVAGLDAVVDAYNPGWDHPDLYAEFRRGTDAVLAGVKQSGVKRVLVVGGAGSLFVAPGVQLVDTPAFAEAVPPNVIPGARAARDALTEIRKETGLEWSFVSPAALLAPGERLGRYRLGGEDLLMDGDKPAGISVADLAVAIVDELETPKHLRQRFTAAY